jgi:chromosome segregation ATPase
VAADKKRLEDELAEERRKAVEATAQFNTATTSEFWSLSLFEQKVVSYKVTVVCANFRNREEELKNALATSRSKIHGLEGKVREIEAGGLELKRAMKEATESEYAVSQKLAYETTARRGLEVEFEVVLKSLQSDQITIEGYEVELNDLKGAANYAMYCIPVPEEGGQ